MGKIAAIKDNKEVQQAIKAAKQEQTQELVRRGQAQTLAEDIYTLSIVAQCAADYGLFTDSGDDELTYNMFRIINEKALELTKLYEADKQPE